MFPPIDIVYAWCGENSGGICSQSGPCRHRDCMELRYSLRSLHKYASWINHIYILVNTEDMKLPSWLNESSKNWITFVDRCKLFDRKEDTPTYNSFAVHTVVHKIHGLMNHFIIMDDDMFFNNNITPSYFFDEKTMKPIIRIKREPQKIYDIDISSNYPIYKYSNLSHQPLPFRIDYIHRFNKEYPDYYLFIQSHKYRYKLLSEFTFLIYYEYAHHQDLILFENTKNFLQLPHCHRINILSEFQQIYKALITHKHIIVFNCNDDFSVDPAQFKQQLSVLKNFYERLYPEIPPFEHGNLSAKKIVIAGCGQNIQSYIHRVFKNIYTITPLFQEYKIIIFENDSTDKTLEILSQYQKKDSNFILLSEKNIPAPPRLVTFRVAYCRNRLMDKIHELCSTYDYLVMIDLDDVSVDPMAIKSFKDIFKDTSWDAVSFNRAVYYDKWALRYPYFTKNCWNFPQRSTCVQYITYLGKHITSLLKKHKMIRVYSAFCGFAIYKISKIKNCRYDGRNKEKPATRMIRGVLARSVQDCEHVSFHREMMDKHDAKIFISSSILFLSAQQTYPLEKNTIYKHSITDIVAT